MVCCGHPTKAHSGTASGVGPGGRSSKVRQCIGKPPLSASWCHCRHRSAAWSPSGRATAKTMVAIPHSGWRSSSRDDRLAPLLSCYHWMLPRGPPAVRRRGSRCRGAPVANPSWSVGLVPWLGGPTSSAMGKDAAHLPPPISSPATPPAPVGSGDNPERCKRSAHRGRSYQPRTALMQLTNGGGTPTRLLRPNAGGAPLANRHSKIATPHRERIPRWRGCAVEKPGGAPLLVGAQQLKVCGKPTPQQETTLAGTQATSLAVSRGHYDTALDTPIRLDARPCGLAGQAERAGHRQRLGA